MRGGIVAKPKYEKWLEEDNLLLLESWARDGLTDEQIAHNMGISTATLYNYKKSHLEILNALKKGKEVVDYEVENALLQRALGYEYEEIKIEKEHGEITKKVTIKKRMPPDTTAQIFWLKNRKPDKWREKQADDNNAEALEKLDNILSEIKEQAKDYDNKCLQKNN